MIDNATVFAPKLSRAGMCASPFLRFASLLGVWESLSVYGIFCNVAVQEQREQSNLVFYNTAYSFRSRVVVTLERKIHVDSTASRTASKQA